MKRKIEFTDIEINELVRFLKICQPERGLYSDHIIRAIIIYFRKYYKTKLGFVNEFISRDECKIYYKGKKEITIGQVLEELEDRKIIKRVKFHVKDKVGNKLWHGQSNQFPTMRTLYKIN